MLKDSSGAYDVWQRNFCEHTVRGERDFENHVAYIHFNPVKHGHASRPVDWPHSSIHKYIERGVLAANSAIAPEIDAHE